MNKLTKQLKSLMRPVAALIAYQSDKEDSDHYFLELRPIDESGRMREAIPVTYAFMNEIAMNYSESHGGTPSGRIPTNLLYADTRKGSEKYIWYNLPQKRMMYFIPGLQIDNAEYYIPGLVYMVKDNKFYIYAFTDKVLKDNTELYAAPFFNTTQEKVCMGITRISKPDNPSYTELLDYWEKKFWLSEFTHLGGQGNPTKSNLVLVTKAAKEKPFDTNELKSLNKHLKYILP